MNVKQEYINYQSRVLNDDSRQALAQCQHLTNCGSPFSNSRTSTGKSKFGNVKRTKRYTESKSKLTSTISDYSIGGQRVTVGQ